MKPSLAGTMAVLLAFGFPALAVEPDKAEYAFRWNPAEGGPSSVEAVHRLLGGRTKSLQEFEVRYHRLPQEGKWPQSATAILRSRTEKDERTEYRLKFRRPVPFEPVQVCPAGFELSYEEDVSFVGPDSARGVYSVSCTGADPQLLEPFHPGPLPCISHVERHGGKKYRVEIWSLPEKRSLIEVSHRAGRNALDRAEFREVVLRLLQAGARPTASSKTELGMDCAETTGRDPEAETRNR